MLVLDIDYDLNYEKVIRKRRLIQSLKEKREGLLESLLESSRTRSARRDVKDFLVSNIDFLNSTSKYHLKAGFKRVIRKAKHLDKQGINSSKKGRKKDNYL